MLGIELFANREIKINLIQGLNILCNLVSQVNVFSFQKVWIFELENMSK